MSNIINKIRISGTDYTLSATTSGGITSGEVETMISAATSGYTARFAEDEEVTAAALNDLNERISGISGNNVVELTQAQYDALVSGGTVDPTAFYIITDATSGDLTQYWTSAQTQSAITSATSGKANSNDSTYSVNASIENDGIHFITLNKNGDQIDYTYEPRIRFQAPLYSDYDDGKVKISGVTAVTSASTDSEIPTAKAVYDAIPQGGGGKTIKAGRGISITTGATADTVSFNLPISAGTGTNSIREGSGTTASSHSSHAEGQNTIANGSYAHAEGRYTRANAAGAHAEGDSTTAGTYAHAEGSYTIASANYSHAEGRYTEADNQSEHASGQYNVSSKANNTFGDSGNTLFSVGNGTSTSARHNAFEIRQNGDIYLTLNGQDVKLQDQLGGGSITVDTALDSGSTNPVENRVIYNKIDEVEQVTAAALNNINDRLSEDEEVTAAGLNAVNDKFDGMKLKKISQTDYDNLQTKDSNTLYIII